MVYFGDNFDHDTLEIIGPRDTFSRDEKIAWSLYVTEPFGVLTVTWVIAKKDGGSESIKLTTYLDVNPAWHHSAGKFRLSSLIKGTGTFVMRYYRDAELLGEGTFHLTK